MRFLPPLLLLCAYGTAFATAALGGSLLVYDDHPGQLYRLWHVLTYGPAPWAWDPGWWAGYPEMQFYPPGFAYVGALLHAVFAGALPVAAVYQVLLWIVYLAPGLTVFAVLTRMLGDGWLALPAAFVALTLSAGLTSGVEGGVHIGMVAARMGWALLPLLPLALGHLLESGGRFPLLATILVAAIALIHPAHLPAAVTFVLLVALAGGPGRLQHLGVAASALVLAAGCTAFWTLPLLARLSYTRALAWGTLSLSTVPLALAACALPALWMPASRLGRALVRWPWLVLGVVIVDLILAERLGVRWLPADRVADGAWLAFLLAAGLAVGRVLERLPGGRRMRPLAAGLAIAVALALSWPQRALTLWPHQNAWPSYEQTARGLRLHALWERLGADGPGRVLFVRSAVPLVYGTEWHRPHTHITSLTPMATGRPIVHGTFTHPSPVAAYVYRGSPDGGAVTQLAEQLDGHRLFGLPLRDLGIALESDGADRLGIAVVVALEDDAVSLSGLTEGGVFRRTIEPPFILYTRKDAVNVPRATGSNRWEFVARGEPGAWVTTRMAYYPLWHAAAKDGPRLTRPGPAGDLEVRLERREETMRLTYAAGLAEWGGVLLSAASVCALGAVAARRRAISGSGRPSSSGRGSPARIDRSTA